MYIQSFRTLKLKLNKKKVDILRDLKNFFVIKPVLLRIEKIFNKLNTFLGGVF